MYYSILKNNPLRLFDVTLRHGLQSISKIYSTQEKLKMVENIILKKNPDAIEIGSIVSSNLIPQLANSLDLFRESSSIIYTSKPVDIFMFTPTIKCVEKAAKYNVNNYSLMTSLSNIYLHKNHNKTIYDNKGELIHMIDIIDNTFTDNKKKLYVTCFSYCPISGKLNNEVIVNEILSYYYNFKTIDDICLTDTYGSLQFTDFKYIIDRLIQNNVNLDRLSLHIQRQTNHQNVKNILCYAMTCGISNFNVTNISTINTSCEQLQCIDYHDIYEII